ncbi:hemicentin-1-like isoform X2 [Centruroides sculpturatus]|uniref:hemicentin-1-like isoform X2 n=1 Tax=Centruroides sculpturatus TaxID=218467 RepID=UPI000C6CBF4F|nr:hemicentin-1-like isoform X2 [Centruroides sculpturatus]
MSTRVGMWERKDFWSSESEVVSLADTQQTWYTRTFVNTFWMALLLWILISTVGGEDIMPGREHVVSGFVGATALLPCDVDLLSCGRVYFITWTKNVSHEWKREYLYSDGVKRAMGDFASPDRATFHLSNTSAHLLLDSLSVSDEGTYKCDVTYVQGKCPSLSFIKLHTLVVPSEPFLELEGRALRNGSTVGPYTEGSTFALECKSSGGRPPPQVTWWNGTKTLPIKVTEIPEKHGTSTVISLARFVLSRWDLGARLECHVESNATTRPFIKGVKLDIHVRPAAMNVRGPLTPVVAGEMVSLTCTVEGARPAANITWYNRSEVIKPQPTITKDLMSDGTYRTTSTLVFVASRHDHHGEYFCKGTNEVLAKRLEAPLLQATTLEVLYPPAALVSPGGVVTVQEDDTTNITCDYDANPKDVTEIVWYKDGNILRRNTEHRPSTVLTIYNVSRHETGTYSCHVRNAFGRGNSTNALMLDVLYPQIIDIKLSSKVVSEAEKTRVVVECIALDGNPREFTSVKWYQNSKLINETSKPIFFLDDIVRENTGLYHCEGLNSVGWSDPSPTKELVVQYPPGVAVINQVEELAVKGTPITLECRVEDFGYPTATIYRWGKDGKLLNASSHVLVTEPIRVVTQGIYSCAAVNDVGTGLSTTFPLKAVAPPAFVQKLPDTGGVPRNATTVTLACRVECQPICQIEWLRNNESVKSSKFFHEKLIKHPEDPKKNIFTSITSVLTWNMSHLPASSFDYNSFTCRSTSNIAGPPVSSTLLFRVEYPPENIQISVIQLQIMEGEVPDDLVCSASAHPLGDYIWKNGDTTISHGPILSFNSSISRDMGGNYTCIVRNRHGLAKADAILTVLHRPDCMLHKDFGNDGTVLLTCIAYASPPVLNFTWYRNNVTIYGQTVDKVEVESLVRYSAESSEESGRYSCVATNEIGASEPCYLDVSPIPSPSGWVQLLLQEENLLIVAGIAGGIGLLLVVVLIIVVIIVIKRRVRASDKEDMEERQKEQNWFMVTSQKFIPKSGPSKLMNSECTYPTVIVQVNCHTGYNLIVKSRPANHSRRNETKDEISNCIRGKCH